MGPTLPNAPMPSVLPISYSPSRGAVSPVRTGGHTGGGFFIASTATGVPPAGVARRSMDSCMGGVRGFCGGCGCGCGGGGGGGGAMSFLMAAAASATIVLTKSCSAGPVFEPTLPVDGTDGNMPLTFGWRGGGGVWVIGMWGL